MIENFKKLEASLKDKITTPKKIAVVKAADEHALQSVFDVAKLGYLIPILIDNKKNIELILNTINIEDCKYEIIDVEDDKLAAFKGVELIREGKADFLMKGHIQTSTFLKEVVNKETGIKKKDVLCHLALLDVPKYNRILGITDGGMILTPTLEQKKQIIEASVDIFNKLGYSNPKVSLLSAAESVNPKQVSSVEAKELSDLFANSKDFTVDGPLSLDISLSESIANEKGYSGKIKGDADILIVPDIVTGNVFAKSLILLADSLMAGMILGAKVPIVLTSRSASETEKKYSIILALLTTGE